MKTSKRILSLLLTIVMMLSIVPLAAVQSSAAVLTQSQFEQKLSAAKSLYPDGSRKNEWSVNGAVVGWQCHGYARWLSWYVWGVDFANGYGENWTLLKAQATSSPIHQLALGDVVRYRSSTANAYNHTIFITNIVGDTIYFTDCNSDGRDTIRWNRTISKSSLDSYLKNTLYGDESSPYGYIAHYTLNTLSTTAPEPPAAPKNVRTETGRTSFSEKESITFLWESSVGATNYWVYMWKDGTQIYSTDVGNATSHTTAPLGSGNYTLIVRAGNAYGYSNEKASVDFIVCNSKPTIATVSSDKSLYKTGENVQLSMSSDCAELYWLGIDKFNETTNTYVRLLTQQVRNSSTFNYTVNEPGIYRVYATACNELGAIDSPPIYCQVYNTVCSDYTYEVISETAQTCRITGYTGESSNIAVPAKISGYAVTEIGNAAFYGCKSLKNVTIPGSVQIIGEVSNFYNGAFAECTTLESVTLESGIKTIGRYTFSGCTSLKSIVIPDTVTEMGVSVFNNCSNLESAVLPGSVESIPERTFYNCVSLANVTIGNGVKRIEKEAFYNCKSLKSIIIPDTVTEIGDNAFYNCTALTIYGYIGSYAESYAKANNIPFVPLDAVSSISIQSKPTKTVYTVGEKFDASGLAVKVTMSDGTTKTVTSGFTVSNPDMSTAGTKTITVTYSGKTASFTITVNPKTVVTNGTLKIGSQTAVVGKTVQIPISVENVNLSILTLTVHYDKSKLKYVSCTDTVFDMIDVNSSTAGKLVFAGIADKGFSNGKILLLTFEVIAADACSTQIAATVDDAYTPQEQPQTLAVENGTVKITKGLLGDLNGDGKVNSIDARWALQVASGNRKLTAEQRAVADVNGDGKVNAIDARWLLQVASGNRVL